MAAAAGICPYRAKARTPAGGYVPLALRGAGVPSASGPVVLRGYPLWGEVAGAVGEGGKSEVVARRAASGSAGKKSCR